MSKYDSFYGLGWIFFSQLRDCLLKEIIPQLLVIMLRLMTETTNK